MRCSLADAIPVFHTLMLFPGTVWTLNHRRSLSGRSYISLLPPNLLLRLGGSKRPHHLLLKPHIYYIPGHQCLAASPTYRGSITTIFASIQLPVSPV
ncbi:hypothetical protein FKP32DRAFT_1051468 [Trametes sanguinea]|nr:hypothetical protein FKP32DRAFT_1051468 [Trametes sanguinea]